MSAEILQQSESVISYQSMNTATLERLNHFLICRILKEIEGLLMTRKAEEFVFRNDCRMGLFCLVPIACHF